MKISKYIIAMFSMVAVIIWASSSSCSNKDLSCSNDATFKNVSHILVNKCGKCHRDSTTAANFARGLVYDFSNYNLTARDTLNGSPYFSNIDTTGGYDPATFGGLPFQDIEGIGFGHPMPLGGPKLTDCEINNIRNWLLKGAPNN